MSHFLQGEEDGHVPLVSLPVLVDPLVILRLLHHWIISRKFIAPSTGYLLHPSQQTTERRDSVRRPAVRRELSLPVDERAIVSQLEAQLVPQVKLDQIFLLSVERKFVMTDRWTCRLSTTTPRR